MCSIEIFIQPASKHTNGPRRLTVALVGLSPPVFHLTNLGLHLGVVLQLHAACGDVLGLGQAVSLLAAALFAVHPVHSEAVRTFLYSKNNLRRC